MMMRSAALTLLLLPALASAAEADKAFALATLRLAPAVQSVSPNQAFALEVRYDGAQAQGAILGVFVAFDDSMFRFDSGLTDRTTFNDPFLTTNPALTEPGVVSFSAGASEAVTKNDVLVATLNFHATRPGSEAFTFITKSPRTTEVYDVNFETIPAALDGATATVSVPLNSDAWVLF